MLLILTVCRKPCTGPRRQTGSHKNRLILCGSAGEHRSMKAVARILKGTEYLLISPSLNTTLCKLKALHCYLLWQRLISLAANTCQGCILYIIIFITQILLGYTNFPGNRNLKTFCLVISNLGQ